MLEALHGGLTVGRLACYVCVWMLEACTADFYRSWRACVRVSVSAGTSFSVWLVRARNDGGNTNWVRLGLRA
jgi:hypothetical protein